MCLGPDERIKLLHLCALQFESLVCIRARLERRRISSDHKNFHTCLSDLHTATNFSSIVSGLKSRAFTFPASTLFFQSSGSSGPKHIHCGKSCAPHGARATTW